MSTGPDITAALMAAISNAIVETSPGSASAPGARIVDMVAARGALMGVLAIVTEADPAVTDDNVAMVGRRIGEAVAKQIGAARQVYKETGNHIWGAGEAGTTH